MRCFVAIEISETIRAGLAELADQMRSQADLDRRDARWVDPRAMHLTLKFLGEVRDNRLAEICRVVRDVAARHSRFEFKVEGVGCFGGRSARVVWVGAGHDSGPLLDLQQNLEEQFDQAGWPREARKFAGHLTLCRVKNASAGRKLADLAKQYEGFALGSMWADSVNVYQSQLTPQGPIYTVLSNSSLLQE